MIAMKRALLLCPIVLVILAPLHSATNAAAAQDSGSMPGSVKQAFATGTRRANGRPGGKYWQNHA